MLHADGCLVARSSDRKPSLLSTVLVVQRLQRPLPAFRGRSRYPHEYAHLPQQILTNLSAVARCC
ncbi:Uncharacterised protein [Vibrio cholerae]|nr:Uncharacterised protein [Vibrio cholerae]CSI72275.1 Uncharacterised protein [Vibrio cholerae]